MSRYWSDFVGELEPYVPGEQPSTGLPLIKLNTNENPYGPSPRVLDALRGAVGDDLRLYPDPGADRLRQTIADYYRVKPAEVFVGNGSDEVLAHIFNGLFRHALPLLFPAVTYSFYRVYCGLYGIDYRELPLDGDFQIAVQDYRQANGGVILPNPNAPTGLLLGLDAIAELVAASADSVVVIDEAYIDFGGDSAVSLIRHYDNLLVVQTLSKSRSLAGLRVGFAVGQRPLIEALERVKNSFNSYPLDALAQAGAVAAFEDRDYFEKSRQWVIDGRREMAGELRALGFRVLPSAANFVFASHASMDAAALQGALRQHNVIVRHFAVPGIDGFLRISVGTLAQRRALYTALGSILGGV